MHSEQLLKMNKEGGEFQWAIRGGFLSSHC